MQLNHDRRGSGEPLVLIHGIGSQWQVWEPLLDRLAAKREVIAIDMPGFGGSATLPVGVPPTPRAVADAVAAFLDELGIEWPSIGGNSLGGWVGLELAKMGRARAVVAISPAGFWNGPEALWCKWQLVFGRAFGRRRPEQVERMMRSPRGRRINLGIVVGAHAERLTHEEAVAISRNGAASPGFASMLPVMAAERFSGGGDVRVPVTLVWGAKDRLLFPVQARRALEQLPAARHVPLPDAGHVPVWDAPDALVRELLAV